MYNVALLAAAVSNIISQFTGTLVKVLKVIITKNKNVEKCTPKGKNTIDLITRKIKTKTNRFRHKWLQIIYPIDSANLKL